MDIESTITALLNCVGLDHIPLMIKAPIIKVTLIDQDLIQHHKITEDLQIMLLFFHFS
jgi:hypothetical protein